MRNVFDQYSQPENKLTHSLVVSLGADKKLLSSFLNMVGCTKPKNLKNIQIVEQSIVGEMEPTEDEAERKGLPDGWIYDDKGWCLLIESKVQSTLTSNQLERHYRTAERCGFTDITVLSIESTQSKVSHRDWLLRLKWTDIFEWLISESVVSHWAKLTANYFEIAERKFIESGYLKEGSLTVFTGIPFGDDCPFNYQEGKRLIKLIREEIVKDKKFCKLAGIDPNKEGRGAITGTGGRAVWDYLCVKGGVEGGDHTANPHFTFALDRDKVITMITVPHRMNTKFKNNLKNLEYKGFFELVSEVTNNMKPLIKKEAAFTPYMTAYQRRYPSQKAVPYMDARLEFDMRTAVEIKGSDVQIQTQWLEALYDSYCNRNSNYQFQIGAVIPYSKSKKVNTRDVLELIKGSWIACKPFVDEITKST